MYMTNRNRARKKQQQQSIVFFYDWYRAVLRPYQVFQVSAAQLDQEFVPFYFVFKRRTNVVGSLTIAQKMLLPDLCGTRFYNAGFSCIHGYISKFHKWFFFQAKLRDPNEVNNW